LVTLRLLSVHAHPDDESSKGAGTVAYYRSRGAEVMVVSCTGGEEGRVLNDSLDAAALAMADRDLPGLRRIEMRNAAAVMDVQHRWLGYADSGREFRPQVMITYDENGGYPHPDHIRTHTISIYARDAAADPARYPGAGPAWTIQKTYYDQIFNPPRLQAIYDALVAADPDSAIITQMDEMRARFADRPDVTTTHIPVGDFLEVRDAALLSHGSQVSPESTFFRWPNDLQRQVWPTEDFQLADSAKPATLPESDLFAGVTDD
jgi:mycothiol S-conjugate amidase